jgi:hypothetical protein
MSLLKVKEEQVAVARCFDRYVGDFGEQVLERDDGDFFGECSENLKLASGNSAVSSCPLLAQSGHSFLHRTCPLSGVKQTWPFVEFRFRGRYWM